MAIAWALMSPKFSHEEHHFGGDSGAQSEGHGVVAELVFLGVEVIESERGLVDHCRTRRLSKTTHVRSARHMQSWGQKETISGNREIWQKKDGNVKFLETRGVWRCVDMSHKKDGTCLFLSFLVKKRQGRVSCHGKRVFF